MSTGQGRIAVPKSHRDGMADASTDLGDAIATAASRPQSATGDNGSVTGRSIDDLIKADQYLAAKRRRGPGFRLSKIVPGGAAP